MSLNERGLQKLFWWGGYEKSCFASQLSNNIYKIKHISSMCASFQARWWRWKQWFWIGGVSKSCLGGQAATTYVLPHNYQSTFVNSNTFYQLALVLWGVALEIRVLSERGLKKPSGWGCCEKLCVTSQLSNSVGKINKYLSTLHQNVTQLCFAWETWIRDLIKHWVSRGDLAKTRWGV